MTTNRDYYYQVCKIRSKLEEMRSLPSYHPRYLDSCQQCASQALQISKELQADMLCGPDDYIRRTRLEIAMVKFYRKTALKVRSMFK